MKTIIAIRILFFLALGSFSLSILPVEENKASDLIRQKLNWQQHERSYWLHLPSDKHMSGPLPVLFHLHGGGGTGKGTSKLTYNRFNELADRDGFIVVYPNAVAKNWNDGRTENLKPQNKEVDDVGFIAEIIETLKKTYNIDTNRIYTTGMSNGGFMSSRLLCDRPDLFRGGAILTASLSVDYISQCNPQNPVAVLVMNGTDDPIVPFAGGDVRLFKKGKGRGKIMSHDDFVAFWKEKNDCKKQGAAIELPDTNKVDGTTVRVTSYKGCRSGGALKIYTINGGGHTWPGGKQYLGKRWIGNTSREINACDEIWEFFKSLE